MVAGGVMNEIFEFANGLIEVTFIWDTLTIKETFLKNG